MKPRSLLIFVSAVVFLSFNSCAHQGVSPNRNNSHATGEAPVTSDALTDASLGALPKKGKAEAEKQADALNSEDDATKALKEIRRREMQEEAQRVQHSINDFRLTDEQQKQR